MTEHPSPDSGPGGSGSTPYDLEVSLGMADDEALERLLDRSLRLGPGRLGRD